MGKLFAVAQPGAVYSEPVTVREHTVITASEVKVGMGFGFGMGGGTAPAETEGRRRVIKNRSSEKLPAGLAEGAEGAAPPVPAR